MKTKLTFLLAIALTMSFAFKGRAQDLCAEPVDTVSGQVSGKSGEDTATCSWLGIPYAAPPVGELRWKAPKPAPAWTGVRDALKYGNRCIQKEGMNMMSIMDWGSGVPTSEDCLYLNVWSPKKSGSFPVMLFIHGGGYNGGSGSTEFYQGDRMAERGDVVVVTINYRLNVLGFLATPALREEDPNKSTGGYGTLDQIAALKWVQENITEFGGDPANVTIFGESAGGWSVCTMLASPLAKGLFHRAILQSGGCQVSASLEKGYRQAEKTAAIFKCAVDDLECLRKIPAKDLMNKGTDLKEGYVWVPHHDGHLLTDSPLAIIRSGDYNKVPFISGSTKNETDVFMYARPKILLAKPKQYQQRISEVMFASDDEAAQIADIYPLSKYDNKVVRAFGALLTDSGFGCPSYLGLAAAADQQTNAYYYRFDYHGLILGKYIKAMHGLDIPYVFNALDRMPAKDMYNQLKLDEPRKLAHIIQGYWINFAHTGDPNGPGLPVWPRFDPAAPRVQVFDVSVRSEPAGMAERCAYWDEYFRTHPSILENDNGSNLEG